MTESPRPDRAIPLTFEEYNRIIASNDNWPVPASTNADEDLAAVRRRFELDAIRVDLRESGALPFNGVTIVESTTDEIMELLQPVGWNSLTFPQITHECVTPDFLWERMAPSLELRDMDGNIPSYSEFESYAILRSHEEFPGTDSDSGIYCDSCDCLRMIWLRYQLTAAMAEIPDLVPDFKRADIVKAISLYNGIKYELEIACDDSNRGNANPASPNHPANGGK